MTGLHQLGGFRFSGLVCQYVLSIIVFLRIEV